MSETNEIQSSEFVQACHDELWSDFDRANSFPNNRPLVAHYTTIFSLESILKNKELWFSHPSQMNDSSEMYGTLRDGYAQFVDSQELKSACGDEHRLAVLRDDFHTRNVVHSEIFSKNTYVACFCEHDEEKDKDGLLSMWRAYGANGSGIATVLDLAKVKENESSPFVLAPINYRSVIEQQARTKSAIDRLAKLIRDRNPSDDELKVASGYFFERLKEYAIFTKHPGFEEEKEWRMAYMSERDNGGKHLHRIDYVLTDRGAFPKLKMNFATDEVDGVQIKLEDIVHSFILGPTNASDLNESAVRIMLGKFDGGVSPELSFANKLRRSGIPYRP